MLLNVIEGLPAHSHYGAALADDDDLAEHVDPDTKPRPPRLTEWSPDVQALSVIADRLGEIMRILIAEKGRKPPKIRPYPRPFTAFDRRKQRKVLTKHRAVVARVLPNKTPE